MNGYDAWGNPIGWGNPTLGMAAGPDTVRAGATTPGAVAWGTVPDGYWNNGYHPYYGNLGAYGNPYWGGFCGTGDGATAPTSPHPVHVRVSVNSQGRPW